MTEKQYAVFVMYPNGLAVADLYETKRRAGHAKYYKLHGNDYKSRVYGRPIVVEIVECTQKEYNNKFDEFFYKYDPDPEPIKR